MYRLEKRFDTRHYQYFDKEIRIFWVLLNVLHQTLMPRAALPLTFLRGPG